MTTWNEYKQTIKSIPKDEMTIIDTLSNLQAERVKRGISQKDFAQRINMKQPQLAKIERCAFIKYTESLCTWLRTRN